MDWYYAEGGRQTGPLDEPSFHALVASGAVTGDTLVWRAGMTGWQPYRAVAAAAIPVVAAVGAAGAPPGTRFCSECGKPHSPEDLIAFGDAVVCAACKPVFVQKLREGVPLAGASRYGGFWIRFLAVFIDGVLLNIVGLTIFSVVAAFSGINWTSPEQVQAQIWRVLTLEAAFGLIGACLAAVYETWFVGKYGATPGKMVCRLKVVTPAGGPISYQRSLGRHFAKYIGAFTLYIGFIIAGFDDEKRALHDRMCDTRVVKA